MKICILSRQVDRLRESCTVIKFSRKEGSHASRPCVTSTALVRRFASDGQVFCRQWQKTHFAPRAHRTAVMRITRRSTFRQRPTFAHTCAHAASRSFAGKLHRYKILAQGRLPSASALNLLLATYGERVSRRVLYCCENSGGERKHIVRHLCRTMGCLLKSRKFFSSVRKEFREPFYIFSGTPIPRSSSPFVSAVSVALVSARRNARTSASACRILQSK